MRRLVLALTSLALVAHPAAALAGTVEVRFYQVVSRSGPEVTVARVVYAAAPGEANRLAVSAGASSVTLSDPAGVEPATGCTRSDAASARCSLAPATAADLRVSLGDMGDTATVSGTLPTDESAYAGGDLVIAGGSGRDRLSAGSSYGVLSGGSGNDRLRAGIGGVLFRGGPGNDRMIGGRLPDEFDEGPVRNGSDIMVGGPRGGDVVSYARRRRGVRADLAGDRDDGQPGERDLIGSSVENLHGGRGPDLLVGDARRNRLTGGAGRDRLRGRGGGDFLEGERGPDRLLGGSGDDNLEGGAGGDRIVGGAGRDSVFAGPGADRIDLRDGRLDELECSAGRDRAVLDGLDWFSNPFGGRCERVRRSRPPAGVYLGGRVVELHATQPLALPLVGCPGDMAGHCRGRVRLLVDRKQVGAARFDVRPSRFERLGVPIDRDVWTSASEGPPVRARVVVEAKDARGRTIIRSQSVVLD